MLTLGADTVDPGSLAYGTLLAWQTVEEIVELLALSTMLLGLILFALGQSGGRSGPRTALDGPRDGGSAAGPPRRGAARSRA